LADQVLTQSIGNIVPHLGEWSLAIGFAAYCIIAWAGANFVTGTSASHVMAMDASFSRRPFGFRHIPVIIVAVALGWFGLLCETFVFTSQFPQLLPQLTCKVTLLPPLQCSLSDLNSFIDRRYVAAIIFGLTLVLALLLRTLVRHRTFYPLWQLVNAIVAFGAIVDLVVGRNEPARLPVLLGTIAMLQFAAAAALALGLWLVRTIKPRTVVRLLFAHSSALALRMAGAIWMLAAWHHLPGATAIAIMIGMFVMPAVAACGAVLAVIANGKA
jgi:hypothetical protein